VEGVTTLWLFIFTAYNYIKATDKTIKSEILYLGLGGFLFLFAFSWGNIIGSFTEDWQLGQYGLLGMPLFLAFMLYSIVRFNTFRIRLLATPALVAISWIMLCVLLFINDISKARSVIIINLIFFGILGYRLILSVRKEVIQRQEIQNLATGLEKANQRLQELDKQKSEFVSIASHQLRSPLTAIRGYASMLIDGSYGVLPNKATAALERINESSILMASSIEDFLNVSRIESGNMKYELTDFNMCEQTAHIVDDLRPEALKVGLVLLYKSDMTAEGIVHADIGKTQQILHNLINNSLKYTPSGSITVLVHENLKYRKLFVEIIDTGIGMSAKTIAELFGKFKRADNANSVNTKGTGLGLFVAREMARAMHGDITAHSDGSGKGSRFILSLPLIK
jgi:signal transduction histidine kinase